MGLVFTSWALVAAVSQAAPSVAVFNLKEGKGVDEKTASSISSVLVAEVRKSEAFSRVVASSELEALMGFERQRQLIDCNATSCMSEIAGSLGVDAILVGELGRVGSRFVLDVKLIDVKTAAVRFAFNEPLKGDEDAVLDAIPRVVAAMTAKLSGTASTPEPIPVTRGPQIVAVTTEEARSGPSIPLLAAGLGGVGAGVVALLLGVVLGVGALGVKIALNEAPPDQQLGKSVMQFQALYLGLAAVGAVVAVMSLLAGLAGAALVVTGVVL